MLEVLIFLVFQAIINLIIRAIHIDRVTYVFGSLSVIIFGVLIFTYPGWSYNIINFLCPPPPGIKCGNAQLGVFFFQLIIGTPVVIKTQMLFNKRLHKLETIAQKFEKQ